MSTEHTRYEIFLSYARKDDVPVAGQEQGWVRALYDQILLDHRSFSTEPLRIFYDTREIRDMDDWRQRILGALRSSKILLVCLSPNYAASEYCRWEWEEYTRRQVHQRMGQDSIAALYFAEMPGAGAAEIAAWLTAVQRGNFTDIRPWFPEGARALQREEVRRRMATLGQSLWERIERARRAEKVPGNLRRQTPYFVGRREELR
ncbi:MAG TPA: toll/interleukin-1 receptor domain-containing protein, partial [Polyangia bacterium]|nr:toll/interleukin-1 receptor domain-containing protein [Polyangia bacterium]